MRVCFLGHQGWGFQAGDAIVLLDPLEKAMGNGSCRLPVWPPRTLLFDAMPSIGGVIISHEHSDHFDLETLVHLPFRGPVHIPDLAADSMRQALMDLGFHIVLMHPYVPFEVSGVTVTPLGMVQNPLEPDVYGLLITASGGQSFLTTIDGIPEPRLASWLQDHCPCRTLDNYTNNEVELLPYLSNHPRGTWAPMGNAVRRLIEFTDEFHPHKLAISGQGWSFPPDRGQLNHEFFAVTNEALARAGETIFPALAWYVPKPGWVLDLERSEELPAAPFVLPGSPLDRSFAPVTHPGTVPPWTSKAFVDEGGVQKVLRFIEDDYGQLLGSHAPQLLAGLHALGSALKGSPEATLFLRIREGEGNHDFRLDRGRLRFEQVDAPDDPSTRFALGIEIWMSDLLALIEGQEEAFLIYESSVRWWSHFPELFSDPICIETFAPFAPRYRPANYLASYRTRLEAGFAMGGQPCLH
jgi:hypothetical protein